MGLFGSRKRPEIRFTFNDGPLVEADLEPHKGWVEERQIALAQPVGSRNVWCSLAVEDLAGQQVVIVRAVDTSTGLPGVAVGYTEDHDVRALVDEGVNLATVWIRSQPSGDPGMLARVRIGHHQFVPRPFW